MLFDYFSHIIGNDHVKHYLVRMAEKKAIANSLLFAGPDGVGKSLFSQAFAKMLICANDPTGSHACKIDAGTHPDIRTYKPEGKIGTHSIDAMRQFSEEVYQSPYEADYKVFIIHDADRMLSYSANALLKTFEEPASQSIIILLSSNPNALLPTILSRCRMLRFHPVEETEIANLVEKQWNKSPEEAKLLAALARGSIGNACRLARQGTNRMRDLLLQLLAKGKMSHYSQLVDAIAEIVTLLDEGRQQTEKDARDALQRSYLDELTSIQKHSVDKEAEGIATMRFTSDVLALYEAIFAWYRDMHLMHVNGDHRFLLHPDSKAEVDQTLQRGEILPLEYVQKSLSQAKLALERSVPVNHCLETLFLKLNFL